MWMVSYVVDIALSVTHLEKVIRGHFDLVLGILNFAFKYGPDRIEKKQVRDIHYNIVYNSSLHRAIHALKSITHKEKPKEYGKSFAQKCA